MRSTGSLKSSVSAIGAMVLCAFLLSRCLTPNAGVDGASYTDSANRMVVGVFGPGATNNYPYLKNIGVNTIVAGASSEVLDAAHSLGLQVIVQPGTHAGAHFNPVKAAEAIRNFDSHPAVKAWYFVDEPAFNRISPDDVHLAAETIREAGATKPLTFTSWKTDQLLPYIESADVLMVDRYPIPWMVPADLGQHVRMGSLAAGKDRPVWAVVQCFSWEAYPEHMGRESNLRPPSYNEMKAMTFDALAQGAEGILFFGYQVTRWNLQDYPGLAVSLEMIIQQVREFEPVLTSPRIWKPLFTDYHDYPNRFNERGFGAVTFAFYQVEADKSSDAFPAGTYLLAVNTTYQKHGLTFHLPEWTSYSGSVVPRMTGGDGLVVDSDGRLSDHFNPLQVRIYGPLP